MSQNLRTRIAPLRAYRKTIKFRLLFHSIRSPKVPQNIIQPQPYQNPNLTPGWILKEPNWPFFGTKHPGGCTIRSSGLNFLCQMLPGVLISAIHSFCRFKLRVWLFSSPNHEYSFSLFSPSSLSFSMAKTLDFLSTHPLNLSI